ncbi:MULTISPECIES: thiol-disulfide oxidoreductase ResA [Evansella]|uniref:thiol-disulfide oxidoreductase ResA n=1 Tax=Evansella TaxID=2837485 RepID=UPI000995F6E6|nr:MULTISPECIES: thiol-disulfide oxidoreductase ResA [Evansella]
MRKRLIYRTAILSIMALVIGYTIFSSISEERGLVDKGDVAPDFILEDMNGNIVHLEEMRGKGIYLTFWATYCSFCRDKMEYLVEHYQDYKEKGVEIVGVNVDEATIQVERFLERRPVPYTTAIDRGLLVGNAYGVTALPYTLLINENGAVIERTVGGKTEEQVLEALEMLVPDSF